MRRAFVLIVLVVVAAASLLMGPGRPSGLLPPSVLSSNVAESSPLRVTVEPLPPLVIDLRITEARRRGGGGTARLAIDVDAAPGVHHLELTLLLPDGMRTEGGPILPGYPMAVSVNGVQPRFTAPVSASRHGAFPIRVNATYSFGEGTTLTTTQGATWRLGVGSEGRHHLGAYEMMGVPLEELSR